MVSQQGPDPSPGPEFPVASRDTLKPKMPLCSCRSLFSRVLFPAPDGPLRTTGRGPDIPVGKAQRSGSPGTLPMGGGWGGYRIHLCLHDHPGTRQGELRTDLCTS